MSGTIEICQKGVTELSADSRTGRLVSNTMADAVLFNRVRAGRDELDLGPWCQASWLEPAKTLRRIPDVPGLDAPPLDPKVKAAIAPAAKALSEQRRLVPARTARSVHKGQRLAFNDHRSLSDWLGWWGLREPARCCFSCLAAG